MVKRGAEAEVVVVAFQVVQEPDLGEAGPELWGRTPPPAPFHRDTHRRAKEREERRGGGEMGRRRREEERWVERRRTGRSSTHQKGRRRC